MIALAVIVLAQTCSALLPAPGTRLEWYRADRLVARDEPITSTASGRTYLRTFSDSRAPVNRTLTCQTSPNGTVLVEQISNGERVSIPVGLPRGRAVQVDGATVERIAAPADGGSAALWFSVARYGPRLYGLQHALGIAEIRTPGGSGRAETMRAVALLAPPAPGAPAIDQSERVRALEYQLEQARSSERRLRDSSTLPRLLPSTVADSIRARTRRSLEESVVRSVRMIADSAELLPSENEARMAARLWPGGGQYYLRTGGAGWIALGSASALAVLAGVALPESAFTDLNLGETAGRVALIGSGAALYVTSLILSRSGLEEQLQRWAGASLTRESFLRNARVEIDPGGALKIVVPH